MSPPVPSTQFPCSECDAVFSHATNRSRHVRVNHQGKKNHVCHICDKEFGRKDVLTKHLKTHESPGYICDTCNKHFSSLIQLEQHEKTHERKRKLPHAPMVRPKKPRLEEDEGCEEAVEGMDSAVRDIYKKNWNAIKNHHQEGKLRSMYNIRWKAGQPQWNDQLNNIFDRQTRRFKINASHSFILYHRENNTYRFFHASLNNNRVFDLPRLIHTKQDFQKFVEDLNNTDALEYARNQRPDSKWTVHSVASTSFCVYLLNDYPMGCCDDNLPDFIKNNFGVCVLEKDKKNNFPYTDNLCFFRCLALHQGAERHNLQTPTRDLFRQWGRDASTFRGVTLMDLNELEELFKVNIHVYEFEELQPSAALVFLRRSETTYDTTLRLLCVQHHFCYITDIRRIARSYACSKCRKSWRREWFMSRHEACCTGVNVKDSYPGGVYRAPSTPLETLKEHGIDVDTKFVYPYRATYDFESYFNKDDVPHPKKENAKTTYTAQHIPMSVSICSNVPSFQEPVCFVGEPQYIVDSMIWHLESIADEAYHQLKENHFGQAYEEIRASEEAQKLTRILDGYLQELPVVGFNSARYDINLIKPYFFKHFVDQGNDANEENDEEEPKEEEKEDAKFNFLVKNGNEYKCISTKKLKFVDITSYLAPGFSYSKYLAAFQVKEKKGVFPYEFVTSLEKLDLPHLPPKDAFFSSLRGQGITDEDYARCEYVWKQQKMVTLKDFLIYYNNLDVVPFLEALEKQTKFYKERGLDMLKDGIGVPGLTLRYLFKTLPSEVYFGLVNDKHGDLHHLMRENMVGGPSIIFHRHHEKDVTRLRDPQQGKVVSSLEGYDANALYLWALMQNMPTEHPIRRRKENQFKMEKLDYFGQMAREWLEWTMHKENITIRHKYNHKEQPIGKRKILVDGWDADQKTVYQFHGCLFHGHDCYLTRGKTTNPINGKPLSELKANTEAITTYLEENTKKVVEMYECEWRKEKQQNPELRVFLKQHFLLYKPPFTPGRPITSEDIIQAVKDERFFGMVQCDIEVPEELRPYFEEMTPIFKNTEVEKAQIGDYMEEYAETHGLLHQPRRTLIGSYFGKGILLTTPLLKWYLDHKLKVTDVQQVVEYVPKACFRDFGETVTSARRNGDSDPSQKILADTFKLLGNSAYGKTITNINKHSTVSYLTDENTKKKINEKLFKNMTPLAEDLNEVEMGREILRWDLPNQIGYFVYQYAKLRMLQFYYDCIDTFVDRSNFQICEMDTDSLYMALSTPCLEDAVPDKLREDFYKSYHHWFPFPACERHRAQFVHCKVQRKQWTQEPCCSAQEKFDTRTPGLFKLEYKGEGIVALCSKTYYCFGQQANKVSCKGVNKKLNDFTKESYLDVLQTQTSKGGINKSFRTDGKTVYTYHQQRDALSYFYVKRQVQPDGVSTIPLMI